MAALQKAHVLGRPMLLEYREDQGGKPLNQRLEYDLHVAGDAGHNTCTTDAADSNVNEHIRACEGKAFSTNTIRTLLAIVCAGRPSSAATGSRQRQPRRAGSSPSSRPSSAARRPPAPPSSLPPATEAFGSML